MRRSLRVVILWAACCCSLQAACKSEVISLGARRCVNTDCAPIDRNATVDEVDIASLIPSEPDITDLEPGTARREWQVDIGCGELASDQCSTGQSGFFLAPQWFVGSDGAITEARATSSPKSRAVLLRKLSPDGELLWDRSGEVPDHGGAVVALAPDGDTGGALLVVGAFGSADGPVDVYSVSAGGDVEQRFALASVGEPAQVAVVDGDIVLLAVANRTLELARYDHKGRLLWRQTQLTPYWDRHDDTGIMSAMMATAGGAAVRVMHRSVDIGYEWDLVHSDGRRSQHRFVGSAPPYVDAMGALFNDPGGLPIAAYEDSDEVYQVMRCTDAGCGSSHARHVEGRPAEEFYSARMLGAAVDADGTVFVATEEGPRSAPRLLIDRISSDFAERRGFVVPDFDISEVTPKALAIGNQGEIYYWSERAIGRIELDR